MIWLLACSWFVAVLLACWPNLFWRLHQRKVLILVLLETALLLFFRLHDGHWPVAVIGGAVGGVFYLLRQEKRAANKTNL